MDTDVFKVAFRKSLERLPREVLETIPALVAKHLPILEKIAPAIVEDMQPHVVAMMAEAPFGILDKDALMTAVKEVLESFGIRETPQKPQAA
jgi:hypothetical protein